MDDSKDVYTFRSFNAYSSVIRNYTYHLWKSQSTTKKVTDILQDFASDTPSFTLSPGEKYEVSYESRRDIPLGFKRPVIVHVKESESFKGTGVSVMKWSEIFLTTTGETYLDAAAYIKDYIKDALEFSKTKKIKDVVNIYTYEKIGGWRPLSSLPPRSIDTIYMDPVVKTKLVDDVNNFISSEQEYIKYGIPYKRCYLMEGIPGSGKSSTIFAIASMLKKDINIFNFSAEVTDNIFISAVSETPSDRILVLEDIDTLFSDRSPIDTNHVSMSAILNVLDGVCRKDKMLVFITTNYLSKIDKAILRPGRMDLILKFSFASKIQIKQMYEKFRGERANPTEFDWFHKAILGKKVGMSLIQKFLFEHKDRDRLVEYEKELTTLIGMYEERDPLGII